MYIGLLPPPGFCRFGGRAGCYSGGAGRESLVCIIVDAVNDRLTVGSPRRRRRWGQRAVELSVAAASSLARASHDQHLERPM